MNKLTLFELLFSWLPLFKNTQMGFVITAKLVGTQTVNHDQAAHVVGNNM
ncbi:hypothetical protein AB4277_15150 [Vibrio splendidus]